MKLSQSMSPKRTWNGVVFPRGEAVEIPLGWDPNDVVALLSWGWVAVPEPEAETMPEVETAHDEPPAIFDPPADPHFVRRRRGKASED